MFYSRHRTLEALQQRRIIIDPFSKGDLKEVCYRLSLGDTLSLPMEKEGKYIYEDFTLKEEGFVLKPGQFLLGKSKEKITLSPGIAALVTTRSFIARAGVDAVQSSILCEPNTDNEIVLEISNQSPIPMKLVAGMPIAKITFVDVS